MTLLDASPYGNLLQTCCQTSSERHHCRGQLHAHCLSWHTHTELVQNILCPSHWHHHCGHQNLPDASPSCFLYLLNNGFWLRICRRQKALRHKCLILSSHMFLWQTHPQTNQDHHPQTVGQPHGHFLSMGTQQGSSRLSTGSSHLSGTVLGLQANLKKTSIVKIACQVEATRIRSCSNEWYLWSKKEIMSLRLDVKAIFCLQVKNMCIA